MITLSAHNTLQARCITLPKPKRWRILNVKIKLNQSNRTCIHKHNNLGHCPYQKAQGGYSYKPPCHLMGSNPCPQGTQPGAWPLGQMHSTWLLYMHIFKINTFLQPPKQIYRSHSHSHQAISSWQCSHRHIWLHWSGMYQIRCKQSIYIRRLFQTL